MDSHGANRTLVPMGQPRRDREWPVPRNTRFVYVLGEDRLATPVQGLVLAWNRHRYRWRALVVHVDNHVHGGRVVQDWIPLERLRPVRADPNKVLRDWRFTELTRPPQDAS